MLTYFVVLGLAAGIAALIFAGLRTRWILKQPMENENLQRVSGFVRSGAMTFLKKEYGALIPFILVVAGFLYVGNDGFLRLQSVSFVIGSVASALAGYIGMRVATEANGRTTYAALDGMDSALRVAFSGGSVMGMSVVGLVFTGLALVVLIAVRQVGASEAAMTASVLPIVSGFSLGASSIALFARVGGGIFTKAADVGADLVGKVEAGIPEDHPLNPATIADNVGDNVGDVAGMGADLFESYVGSIIGTMVLGAAFMSIPEWSDNFNGLSAVLLPLVLAATGIITSIMGTFFVRVKEGGNPQSALNIGEFAAAAVMLVASFFIIQWMLPAEWTFSGQTITSLGVFWATIFGLAAGLLIGLVTEHS